jgi:hypothetical protein
MKSYQIPKKIVLIAVLSAAFANINSCSLDTYTNLYCEENSEVCIRIVKHFLSSPYVVLGELHIKIFKERQFTNLIQISNKSFRSVKPYEDYYKCFSVKENIIAEFDCNENLTYSQFVKNWYFFHYIDFK